MFEKQFFFKIINYKLKKYSLHYKLVKIFILYTSQNKQNSNKSKIIIFDYVININGDYILQ